MHPRPAKPYEFKLFVRGHSEASARTIQNVRDGLEQRVPGRYSLQVIDVHQQPEQVRELNVIATPTLVRVWPEPSRRSVGCMMHPDAMNRLKLL